MPEHEPPTLEMPAINYDTLAPAGRQPEIPLVDPDLLAIQTLQEATLQILKDPEATRWDQTKAILGELSNHNPDLEQFVVGSRKDVKALQKNHGVLTDVEMQQKLVEKAQEYAGMQEVLVTITTPDFLHSIPSPDRRELSKIKGVVDRFSKTLDHRRVYDKFAVQIEIAHATPGFSEYFDQNKAAKGIDERPIAERCQIINKVKEIFIDEKAKADQKAAEAARILAVKEAADRQAEAEKQARLQKKAGQQIAKVLAKEERKASKRQKMGAKQKHGTQGTDTANNQLQIDFDAVENSHAKATSEHETAIPTTGVNFSRTSSDDKIRLTISIAMPKSSGKLVRQVAGKASLASQRVHSEIENMGDDPRKRVAAIAITAALSIGASSAFLKTEEAVQGILFGDKKAQELSPADADPPVASDFIKPSVEAQRRLQLAPEAPLTKKSSREIIVEQAEDYAKAKLYQIGAQASKVEPSRAEDEETRPTVIGIDKIALFGIKLAVHNPDITSKQIDQISEWASDAMLAVRHPKIAQKVVPAEGFEAELSAFLQNSALKDLPGIDQYTAEQKAVIGALLSKIYNKIAPKAEQDEVADALIAKVADIAGVLEKNSRPDSNKPKANKNKNSKEIAEVNAISPAVGRGMPESTRRRLKKTFIKAGRKYEVSPNFIASFYYVENIRIGDSTNNANSAAGIPATGDAHTWRQPAAPYGKGKSYGVSTAKAAGPMQFTPPTWHDYGVDANGDGKKDWLDLKDSLYAAAKMLAANGGKKGSPQASLRKAAHRYNQSQTYVQSVINTFNYLESVQEKAATRPGNNSSRNKVRYTPMREEKIKQERGERIVNIARRELKRYGNRNLEKRGQNIGPVVQKYTNGRIEPWCAGFATYVYQAAGYDTGRILAVRYVREWFKENGVHFSNNSKIKPRAGDMVMYRNTHMELVERVNGNTITTLGGNVSSTGNSNNGNSLRRKRVNYKQVTADFGRLRVR